MLQSGISYFDFGGVLGGILSDEASASSDSCDGVGLLLRCEFTPVSLVPQAWF